VITAMTVNPGVFASCRNATLISLSISAESGLKAY
jgi:hypothetical protein